MTRLAGGKVLPVVCQQVLCVPFNIPEVVV